MRNFSTFVPWHDGVIHLGRYLNGGVTLIERPVRVESCLREVCRIMFTAFEYETNEIGFLSEKVLRILRQPKSLWGASLARLYIAPSEADCLLRAVRFVQDCVDDGASNGVFVYTNLNSGKSVVLIHPSLMV